MTDKKKDEEVFPAGHEPAYIRGRRFAEQNMPRILDHATGKERGLFDPVPKEEAATPQKRVVSKEELLERSKGVKIKNAVAVAVPDWMNKAFIERGLSVVDLGNFDSLSEVMTIAANHNKKLGIMLVGDQTTGTASCYTTTDNEPEMDEADTRLVRSASIALFHILFGLLPKEKSPALEEKSADKAPTKKTTKKSTAKKGTTKKISSAKKKTAK